MQHISEKDFRNNFVYHFEGDESGDLSPRQTPGVFYSKAPPTPVKAPKLLGWSAELARELEIAAPHEQDVEILAGNRITPSMHPYAACYGGHQFGNWAGQLGDGRAITLGEWVSSGGRSWELQLKGAGPTAYSRRADGRAVLRSSVREYLMSEAMHYLGVPTTRALSLVSTGEQVLRDMFYNGNPEFEPGAIVLRVAPSFLRFGNFQILAARGEMEHLKQLVDWTIDCFYPHLKGEDKMMEWFRELVDRTSSLVVDWIRVGFVHGVMNTDNMSILGLTIDYGPYSFVDAYDPNFTPNTTDLPGRRYAFGRQISIAGWNLARLAEAIAPLLEDTKELEAVLDTYQEAVAVKYYQMMAGKLGFDEVREEDVRFIRELDNVLSMIKPDMTIFFQRLMELPENMEEVEEVLSHFNSCFYKEVGGEEAKTFYSLIKAYRERMKMNMGSREEALAKMKTHNPRFILRNYLLHQAIEGLEKGDDRLFKKLEEAIKDPYSKKFDEFLVKRPEWANEKAGCSMLSCSS